MPVKNILPAGLFVAILALAAPIVADVVDLKSDHPERYVVQKGDTLWDIANRFLKDPWRWASVWKINEQVKNPHLIYPGDVIILTYVDGKPQLTVQREEKVEAPPPPPAAAPVEPEVAVESEAAPIVSEVSTEGPREVPVGQTPGGLKIVKLRPRAYGSPIADAIPTISPDVILPFLTETRVVGRSELSDAGYVMIGQDDRLALGNGSQFYARGLKKNGGAEFYQVFRPGRPLVDPDSGSVLAYEALHLGDARMIAPGDPARMEVIRARQEIVPADRLMESPEKVAYPYYFPHAPDKTVHGRIISVENGVSAIGTQAVVTISLGKRDGMEDGHVLRIMRYIGYRKDPISRFGKKIPEEEAGLLMVFRVFDKVSYGLVMNADRAIQIHDSVQTP